MSLKITSLQPSDFCSSAVVVGFVAVFFCASGCATSSGRRGPSPAAGISNVEMKPVVAVMDFENRAGFSGRWELGSGMADMMSTALLDSDRFTLLERQHLDDVVGEILRQGKDLFRKEGRVEQGRLKNAQYLIRGAITDFTVTQDASGWFAYTGAGLLGRSSKARVAIHVRVSDVETGEILVSVAEHATAPAGGMKANVDYKKISFGGDVFFRTPLGKATERAMRKAVRRIMQKMPETYWEPRVAEAEPGMVIINGGRNVRLRTGDEFVVRLAARPVTDPVTGNVIEMIPGRERGRIEVIEVNEKSAYAVISEGDALRGDILEKINR